MLIFDKYQFVISFRRMFWSSYNFVQGLWTATMDGHERHPLLAENPSALALDRPAKRLYWSDLKLRKVFTSKYDFSDKHEVKISSNSKWSFQDIV